MSNLEAVLVVVVVLAGMIINNFVWYLSYKQLNNKWKTEYTKMEEEWRGIFRQISNDKIKNQWGNSNK